LRDHAANPKNGSSLNLAGEPGAPDSTTQVFKCRDTEFYLGLKTHIMGVLNTTPDSFYDGGNYTNIDAALRHVEKMIEEGADIVDIGGESTRPGSLGISEVDELERVIPVVKEIRKHFDIPLSIDTTKSTVARQALEEGVSIVNDISGLTFDPEIAQVVSEFGAGMVLTHTTSRPLDMQSKTEYGSLIEDIKDSLGNSVNIAEQKGVNPGSIIVDPGFGFGKTVEQNLALLKYLQSFRQLGKPILIGTSNKSFIGKVLKAPKEDRIEGTAATIAIGILNGASIIRVHETGYMKLVSKMIDAILNVSYESY
jgi:dihydropteroate synthase